MYTKHVLRLTLLLLQTHSGHQMPHKTCKFNTGTMQPKLFENRLMMQSRPATASSLLQVWKENTTNYRKTHRKTSQERRVTGPWRTVSVLIGERITTVRKIMAEGAQYQASSQDTVPRICEKECIFSSFSCIIRPRSSMSIMLTVRYTRYTHLCPHQVSHFTSDG